MGQTFNKTKIFEKVQSILLEPAPQGMGAPQSDQGHAEASGNPTHNFSLPFCESTFEVMSTQSAPDLTGKSVGYAISDIFLFPNEPMAYQILNLKKIVCLQVV